jgi:menaquinol-cytochrome c reductase iron-sulfur subunit
MAVAAVAVPSVGFLLGLRRTPRLWRDVGAVEQFALGGTVQVAFADPSPLPWAGVTAQTAAWLRRTGDQEFVAFSVDCTHLGCPVRWLPDADLFMCPCHGGVFYSNGTVASGPPPRPLSRYPVRVAEGRVQILASPLPIT